MISKILFCQVFVLSLVVASILALPQQRQRIVTDPRNPQSATIIQHENNNIGVGSYHFAYQTSDGVSREEKAELKNPGTENEALVVQGSYSYVGEDGVTYTVNYIADENGFRPTGVHIPGTNNI